MCANALIDKRSFIGLDECAWLFTGAETPPHEAFIAQMKQYLTHRGQGPGGREKNSEIEQSCKRNVAALLKGSPEQIAFLSNSSEIIDMITRSIDFEPGDNIVINKLEFPSGVLPALRLKEKGVEVRLVEHEQWKITVDSVMKQVDHRTKLVIASHVSYLSGARLDYQRLYDRLRTTGALFLLDVTQSLGAIPVDMNYADFVVCSSYKWLLSVHGAGILGVNPARAAGFLPDAAGWRCTADMFSPKRFDTFDYYSDARKFETGYPSYPTLYTLNYSTRLLLDVGIERIERHILELGGQMIEALKERGYTVMTPETPHQRAGNISVLCADGEALADELRRHRVYVWGGDGRLRASVHAFNDTQDIETFIKYLPYASGSRAVGGRR
jgi:selenocysteine lyase/cysteine desulfurase